MLDLPTDWFPRNTIFILILPVTVLTELFILSIQYNDQIILHAKLSFVSFLLTNSLKKMASLNKN